MSISVFSMASFVSMVALLAQLHTNRADYAAIPLVILTQKAWHGLEKVTAKLMEYGNVTMDY